MRVLRLSYVFMFFTLLYLCITSCAETQSTASTRSTTRYQSSTLASFSQAGSFTDSTPSLVVYPSPLNEQNCQTSNNKTWTCVVTLEGENLAGILVIWNAYTPNSSISISPNKGSLAELIPTIKVAISNISCINTSILFSGQVYGGGGVIPITVPWSCIPQPTLTPILRPTSIPSPQPSPTPKIKVPTSTPVAITIPKPTPTMTSPFTSEIAHSHSDPSVKGSENSSANIFLVSASIFLVLESLVAIVIIAMLIRRKIFKRP